MIINSDTSLHDSIYRNTATLLNEKRMKAEIKILPDDFGSRTKEDIIHAESARADLLFLGISPKPSAFSKEYMHSLHKILDLPTSMLLLSPSNEFEEINLADKTLPKAKPAITVADELQMPLFPRVSNRVVLGRLEKLDADGMATATAFADKGTDNAVMQLLLVLEDIKDFTRQNRSVLEKEILKDGKHEFAKTVSRGHQAFLRGITALVETQSPKCLKEAEKALAEGMTAFVTRLGNLVYETPETILVQFSAPGAGKEKNHKFQFQRYIAHHVNTTIYQAAKQQAEKLEKMSMLLFTGLRDILLGINDSYEKLALLPGTGHENQLLAIDGSIQQLEAFEEQLVRFKGEARHSLLITFRNLVVQMAGDLGSPVALRKTRKKEKKPWKRAC
ncbi:MAG: hypothetical protein HC896_10800 [Bacteroidales bacterium]|nr:hypothetical protein [Bacteroidales bacterium]